MPIPVVCANGHKLNAKDSLAGKKVKCPACGSIVKIPEFADLLPNPEVVPSSSEVDDPLGIGNLDGLNSWPESTPLPPTNIPAPTYSPAPVYSPPAFGPSFAASTAPRNEPASPAQDKSNKLPLILGIAGGVSFLAIVLVAVVVWMVIGGSKPSPENPSSGELAGNVLPASPADVRPEQLVPPAQTPPTTTVPRESGSPTPPSSTTPSSSPPSASPPNSDSPAPSALQPSLKPSPQPSPQNSSPKPPLNSPPNSRPPSPADLPPLPPSEPTPFDLKPMLVDSRLASYELSAPTWAAAFDVQSARLAVTHDKQGILVYALDDVMRGRMSPVKTFPTSGLPTGVCMKPLGDRRVFVVAGRDAPQLSVYDVDSFEHVRDIPLTGLEFVDYLAASANPNDPYVYFSTQSIKETKVQRTSNDGPPSTADRLGRVNLLTGEQSPNTTASFNDITVSPDGQRLWARFTANTASVSGEWEHLQTFTGNSDDVTIYLKRDPPARAPMRFLGDQVASNRFIFSPTLRVFRAETDFYPGAVFEHRPILVGTNDKGIVFASANDYRQLATIPLPDPWISKYSQEDVVDFRQRGVAGAFLQTPFLDVQADSRRERAVLTTGNLLLISPLSFVKLPDEPSLALRTELPERIAPDEPFEIPLETVVPIEGAVIEAVHNSDWLPDEEQTIVGQDAPGKRSPLTLALKQDMRKDSNSVILTNYDFLEGMSYPFWLRVGREMMRVRKRADFALMVQRTMQIGHSTEERVAVIDNSGREMPIGPPEKRGIRLELRAALSDDQDWILVNDLRALKGQPVPAEMVVGNESMTLLSIDEFKNTLQVKRPKPKGHSVSDKVVVMKAAESDSQSSLVPNVRDGKLSWTPTSAQLGRQTVRLRVRTGALSRDWFWEVRVERTDGAAPRLAANTSGKNTPNDGKAGGGDKGGPGSSFHVLGIEPLRGSKLGVIWGQSKPPNDNLPGGAIPTSPDGKYYLGVCDVTTGAVLRHKELSQPISAATIHSTGIYAATPLDGLPPSNLAPKRSQIVRYDGETLEPISEVEVSCPVYRLQTIADRYLSAPGVRLQIPDLTGAAPVEFPMPLTSAGRCRSGWVWDGVLWDEAMQKPQLILMPGLLSPLSEQQQNAGLASAPGGTIRITPNSCYTCTFGPLNTPFEGEFPLVSLPGAISSGRGVVRIHSWADASKFAGRSLPTLKSATLFEEMKLPLELRPLFLRMSAGYVAEGDGMAHVAVMGRLYRVPLPQPNETSQEFRFVERQSALSLPASTFNKVSYSAPGAVRYQLELRHDRAPSDLELPAIVGLESNDGNFELPQFDIDALIAHLFSRLRLDNVTVRVDQKIEAITSHTKRYNRVFKQLTGRPLKGIPTFVYASVVAEHGDGQSKAGLSHCYILEIPAEYVRDAIWR